eukprot:TRINITY_DN60572_c0_g1_i1.p1 TRINITY_DN60572_c0_g1~~TRINITY_DN60572_c0_g1_i1.p1  ORF type:complete len:159 (-),score=35.35 TRINITY_DN60572_c0_g1_i1:20-433(-)
MDATPLLLPIVPTVFALGALGGWALTRAHYTTYSDYASPSVIVPVEITNNNNPVITASASGSADATNTNNDQDDLDVTATNTNTATNNGKKRKRSVSYFNLYKWLEHKRGKRENPQELVLKKGKQKLYENSEPKLDK